MIRYFDRQGKPIIGTLEWGRMLEDREYCRVAETILDDGTRVSTAWLGLDHNYGDDPPLIFETTTFAEDDGDEQDQERYSTEQEALEGHQHMVEKWSPHE